MNAEDKLEILSRDGQYDLACACGSQKDDRRHRSKNNTWIYPVTVPQGGVSYIFKTLLSNSCVNDCKYCPLRADNDTRRCSLQPDRLAEIFLEYYRKNMVQGLFLSSGVRENPDAAMAKINDAAWILRKKKRFRGYIHLKVIPGASDSAVEEAVSLGNSVSINIEAPGENNFRKLSLSKDYIKDVIRPLKLISKLTGRGNRYSRVKQTTQFVVGASDETDREIIKYSWGLYKRLGLNRIYFSAYQRGLGDQDLPGESSAAGNGDLLTREHRLYQVDFLIRKYGFDAEEIPVGNDGNLSLLIDPKESWAKCHPEKFPVDINKADRHELLRVPGLGHVTADFILKVRSRGGRLRNLENIGRVGKRLRKAEQYITF
ncbi:radical SAM protein [Verrucomicrobiota bacterium]